MSQTTYIHDIHKLLFQLSHLTLGRKGKKMYFPLFFFTTKVIVQSFKNVVLWKCYEHVILPDQIDC